jgi:hypothetical protein
MAPALPALTLIHPSAWNRNSAKFRIAPVQHLLAFRAEVGRPGILFRFFIMPGDTDILRMGTQLYRTSQEPLRFASKPSPTAL